MKNFLRQTLITIALAVVIFLVMQMTFQSSVVIGSSMEPSFTQGQRLVVDKLVYHFHEPERGDVIILHPPANGQVDYIKRIVGLPGDTVEIKNRTVYINGSPLEEPYIADPPSYSMAKKEIPEGQYFVLGDNRNNSNDSHTGWLLPRENIIGKAWITIWPPSEFGTVPSYDLNSPQP